MLRAIFGLLGSLLAAAVGGWLGFMFFGNWQGAAIAAVVVFLFSFGKIGGRRFSSAAAVFVGRRRLFGWWRQLRRRRRLGELVR
jgi:hypothetical protein